MGTQKDTHLYYVSEYNYSATTSKATSTETSL